MPPKKAIGSAPADRIYRSETPLRQTRLAARKTKKMPRYGKAGGARVPKPPVQETLTQMDYIFQQKPDDGFREQDEDEDEDFEPYRQKAKKRRRTLGDESSAESKFHTQRLTQMDWSFSSNMDDDEEEEEQDGLHQETLEKLQSPAKKKGLRNMPPPPRTPSRIRPMEIPPSESPASPISPVHYASPKKSPLKRMSRNLSASAGNVENIGYTSTKKRKASLSQQRPSPRRPLQEKSTNTAIPFSLSPRALASPRKQPKLVIQDTFETDLETQQSRIPSSPPKRLSPIKSARPKLVIEDTFETDLETQLSHRVPSSPPKRTSPAKSVRFKTPEQIIDDSPQLSGVSRILQSPIVKSEPRTQSPRTRAPRPSILKLEISDSEEDSDIEVDSEDEELDLPVNRKLQILDAPEEESQIVEETPDDDIPMKIGDQPVEDDGTEASHYDTYYEDFGAETQMHLDELERDISASAEMDEEDEDEEDEESNQIEADETQYGKTQGMESQRLSTQHMNMMAPRTMSSDIFLSAHPQKVTEIVSRAKNHYFSSHMLPSNVSRIWLYETDPVRVLKYMASISHALKPGELKDEEGSGNAEFNAGQMTVSKYAYEILELYELADPLPLEELQRKEWLYKAPGAKAFVRPSVIGELIANLKPPLFSTTTGPSSSFTDDTQEVEAQLVSESTQFQHSTAPTTSSPSLPATKTTFANIFARKTNYVPQRSSSPLPALPPLPRPHPATQSSSTANNNPSGYRQQQARTPIRPSQASTVDLTQPPTQQTQRPRHTRTEAQTQTPIRRPSSRSSDVEIIFESPIRCQPHHLPTSTPISSGENDQAAEDTGSDTLIPLAMPSSQILTKSQLLPDSLLTESVPPPPMMGLGLGMMFPGDSDDDDEHYGGEGDY